MLDRDLEHPGLYNEPVYVAVHLCAGCGQDIYDGDRFLPMGGAEFCEDCVEKMMVYAEVWRDE